MKLPNGIYRANLQSGLPGDGDIIRVVGNIYYVNNDKTKHPNRDWAHDYLTRCCVRLDSFKLYNKKCK